MSDVPWQAQCPTPARPGGDGRHIADLGDRTSVDLNVVPHPLCRGCGVVLHDDPRFPEYWTIRDFVILEEPW